MKHPTIILVLVSVVMMSCRKNSSDSDRIRQLEEENARLRRAAGQSAALVPATEKPSQDVIDAAVRGIFGKAGYTITNDYSRQVHDETFRVYEFELDRPVLGRMDGHYVQITKVAIGFVKRGNSWYSRRWDENQ